MTRLTEPESSICSSAAAGVDGVMDTNLHTFPNATRVSPANRLYDLISEGPPSNSPAWSTAWFDDQFTWTQEMVALAAATLPNITRREEWGTALCWPSAMFDLEIDEGVDDSFAHMRCAGGEIAQLLAEHVARIPSCLSTRVFNHFVDLAAVGTLTDDERRFFVAAVADPAAQFEQYACNFPIADTCGSDGQPVFVEQGLHRLCSWLVHTESTDPCPEDLLGVAAGISGMLRRLPALAADTASRIVCLLEGHIRRLSTFENAWALCEAIRAELVGCGFAPDPVVRRLLDQLPASTTAEWVSDHFGDEWFLCFDW